MVLAIEKIGVFRFDKFPTVKAPRQGRATDMWTRGFYSKGPSRVWKTDTFWYFNIAMENHNVQWVNPCKSDSVNPLWMAILNKYKTK